MFNRWIEDDHLLDTLETVGAGCIAFSPLAQGLLTDRYLHGIPDDSRVATGARCRAAMITEERLANVRALADIATRQRTEPRSARAGLGPSRSAHDLGRHRCEQRLAADDNLGALDHLSLTAEELDEIDAYAVDEGINLWAQSSDG